MSVNGIWKIEMLGPYGWQTIATSFLEDGDYKGASRDHYTVGNYEISGSRIEISAFTMQHGEARTVFGEKKKELNLKLEGEIEKKQSEIGKYITEKLDNDDKNINAEDVKIVNSYNEIKDIRNKIYIKRKDIDELKNQKSESSSS